MHKFLLTCADTDAITICKPDQSPFSIEETLQLTEELNSIFDEGINWEFEFNYPKMIVLKVKNYIMLTDEGKIKTKGSAVKASTKCVALKEFINRCIDVLIFDKGDLKTIYEEYVNEIMALKEMSRWSMRKTVSEKVMTSERANESKVRDAIEDTEYVEGDRVRMFYLENDALELEQNFNGDYNRQRLLKNLYDTSCLFSTILPDEGEHIFINYSLVKQIKPLYNKYNMEFISKKKPKKEEAA